MALFYWIGKTGNGNVNLTSNWTLWGSSGGTALPPEALTRPKYNDSITFSRFTLSGTTVYPIFGPSGQLTGLCGPAGNTTAQYISQLKVDEVCPVPLGTTSVPFTIGAGNVNITVPTSGGPGYPYYLTLNDNSGVTQQDSIVTVFSKKTHEFYINGVVSKIQINNTQTSPSAGVFYLENLELTSSTNTITDINSQLNSFDKIFVYPSTITGTARIALGGKSTEFFIKKGFAINDGSLALVNYTSNPSHGPRVYFYEEGPTGASGPASTTRTFIKELSTTSQFKDAPVINVNHGVDIVDLNLSGGQINFNQEETSDVTIVQKGLFNTLNTKMTSINASVTIGSNGDFIVSNTSGNIPEITMKGLYNYDMTPISGVGFCGPLG
jgi:hypothetical protein